MIESDKILVSAPILLYDGVCGLCNRLVQFILRRDHKAIFRFAALQSPFAASVLARHGADAANLDTVYVIQNYNSGDEDHAKPHLRESLLARSDAIIFVLRQFGGIWLLGAAILRMVPRRLRDWGYNLVARTRYRIFGRYDACPLPTPETRSRFLDS